MLSSITPLGERGRGQRWWLTVSAYLVGAVAGGALTGAVAGLLGTALHRAGLGDAAALALAAALAVLALVADLPGSRLALPRWRRQVNEDWLPRYRGWVYGLGFGVQLGMGLVTIVVSGVIYLAFALAVLSGSLAGGLAVGVAFGLVKGLIVLVGAPVRSTEQLLGFHRRLDRWRGWSLRLAAGGDLAALVVLSVVGIASVVG